MKSFLFLFVFLISNISYANCDNYFGTLDAIQIYEAQYGEIEAGPGAHFLEGRGRRQTNDPRFLEEGPGDGRFYENRDPYSDSIDRVPESYENIPGYNEPGSETQF